MEKLFDGEYKLMEVLWEVGAVHSARLVELCAQRLGWNKSTTYTVLRRLKNKGAVDHRDTVVTPLLTREAAIRAEGAELERRAGGLSPFLAACFGGRSAGGGLESAPRAEHAVHQTFPIIGVCHKTSLRAVFFLSV